MISITSKTVDTAGVLVFDELPSSDLMSSTSRVSMSPTLDGGGVLDNQGFSHSDRVLRIRANLSPTQAATLWAMYKSHLEFNISFFDGFYPGAIQGVKLAIDPVIITFLIEGVNE